MKKISKVAFMLVGIVLLVAACSRKIYIPVEKTVTVTETVRDTVVQVQLEKEYVKVITPDTTSTVETKYARSTATYHGEPLLTHTLTHYQLPFTIRRFLRRSLTVTTHRF